MSFSTSSWKHPTVVVTAPAAPRTLRKSRRLTPADPEGSVMWLISKSVMAGAAIVASFLGRQGLIRGGRVPLGVAHRVGGLVAVDVAVDAPAHVERGELVDALHALHLAVAALTRHAGIHVAHVREVHVLGKLMDADPRNRFLGLAARIRVGIEQLLDFGA